MVELSKAVKQLSFANT